MSEDVVVPLMIFSIPIIAICGGIIAGVVRSFGQQRMLELAQKERIAAIERGIDPNKLPPLPQFANDFGPITYTPYEAAKRRAQGLTIGGLVVLFGGLGISVFFLATRIEWDKNLWAIGLIPVFVGAALLLSAWIVWPRNGDPHAGAGGTHLPPTPPPAA